MRTNEGALETNSAEQSAVAKRKNFVKQNILHAKRSCPIEPKWRYVDTRHGDTHDLKPSGLLPIYVYKKSFGKVPKFAKIVTDVKTTEIGHDGDEVSKISSCRHIDEEERRMLLDGMKHKWEEMMKRFQGLPFLADTLPKAQRKARLERELQQLEKDIVIIERHQHIYIYDDDA